MEKIMTNNEKLVVDTLKELGRTYLSKEELNWRVGLIEEKCAFLTHQEKAKLKEARGQKITSKEKELINQEVQDFIKTRELIESLN
jgi:hypothetical protein